MSNGSFAEAMASAAREMHAQNTSESTIEVAAVLAVLDIEGCEEASVSVVHRRGRVETPSASSPQARRADQLQYELQQGPCLQAIWDNPTVQSGDLAGDSRWDTWGPRVADETGFRSLLAMRLFTKDDTVGALNMYSTRTEGFSARDQEVGLALAAQVAVAIRGTQTDENLRQALSSRSMIGMSMGMLMERFELSEHQAFLMLTRLASTEERRVVDVAEYIVLTREVPGEPGADDELSGV